MKIAIINIGDELLNGRTQDLNAFWLGEFLKSKGIKLSCATTILDKPDQMCEMFSDYFLKFDVVITTGGVGPTVDDRTKSCLSKAFNKKLEFSEASRELVLSHYKRINKNWDDLKTLTQEKSPEQNYEYAPTDFRPLLNPKGLAPGFLFEDNSRFIISCPGVPTEFHAMFEQVIYPILVNKFQLKSKTIKQYVIRTKGIAEEKIFYQEDKSLWSKLEKYGSVSSLPYKQGVDIIITSTDNGFSHMDIEQLNETITDSPINQYVWQIGDLSLPQYIVERAIEKGITFGFAESCTGGLLAHQITNVAGSSKVFFGSIISYDNSVKTKILKVSQEDLNNHGAVSEQIAYQMAKGAKEELGVQICVSTSGIAGPGGGSEAKPVGLVAIGSSSNKSTQSHFFQFNGNRTELKERFARKALYTLLDQINLTK